MPRRILSLGGDGRRQVAQGLYGPDSGFNSNPAHPAKEKQGEFGFVPKLLGYVVQKVGQAGI